MTETKICTICKEEKDVCDFYKQKKHSKKRGHYYTYSSDCKDCRIKRNKHYQRENKEKISEYCRQKYLDDPYYFKTKAKKWSNLNKEKHKNQQKEWRKSNPERIREYNAYRESHKKHDISDDEINELYQYCNSSCMYCGISEEEHVRLHNQKLHRDHAYNDGSNGIDNCVLACKSCNASKRNNDWDVWYPQADFYDEEKYKSIKNWLDSFIYIN